MGSKSKGGKAMTRTSRFSLTILLALLTIFLISSVSQAAVNYYKGSFPKSTNTSTPVSQSVTGVGFQPKAVIFFWTRQTASGYSAPLSMGYGFATGPGSGNQAAVAVASDDAVGTTNAGTRHSNANSIIILSNGTPTMTAQAALTSMDADGFTISWTTNENRADIIHFIAIGGADITNVKVGLYNFPTTGTTPFTNSATGVGFQPDMLLFLSPTRGAVADANVATAALNVGFARTATEEGCFGWGVRDGQTGGSSGHVISNTRALYLMRRDSSDGVANLASMDADGFTMNIETVAGGTQPVYYLAIKGGQNKIGFFTQPTAGTPPISQATTGVGFQPVGILFGSANTAALYNTVESAGATAAKFSVGSASSSTQRGAIWGHDTDGAGTTDTNNNTVTNRAILLATNPNTTNADADFTSFDTDGFTLSWTTRNDTTARKILYWAIGNAPGDITPPGNVTGLTITNPGTGNQLNLSWTNPGDADFAGVRIRRATGAAPADCASGTQVADVTAPTNTYNDTTGLLDGTTYYYRLCAYDEVPNYASGTTGSGTPTDTTAPGNVTGLTITNPGTGNQLNLSWTNPASADFAGVRIRRATGAAPADCASGTQVADVTAPTNTYNDTTGLLDGTTYYYRLCAYDEVPNYASGTTGSGTPTDTTAPGNVTGLTITNPGTGNQLNLSWTNPGDADFAGVRIRRATGAAPADCASGTQVADVTAPTNTYNDTTGLLDGTTYYYRLCAYDEVPNYASGTTGSGTPTDTTAPGNVTGLSVTPGDAQLTLNWTNPADADYAGVRIARATGATPPANCSTPITTVNAPGTSYVDSPLTNGQQYSYRLCSIDEVPNVSSGTTGSGTPSGGTGGSPTLSSGGVNPSSGGTSTNFSFTVVYTDAENDAPAAGYPKIYIGDNDGFFGYGMSLDSNAAAALRDGNYANGEQYVFTVSPGAASDMRYYFEAQAATGDTTIVTLPAGAPASYSTGPSVHLFYSQNVVGVPKDLGAGIPYSSILADDSGYSWCQRWNSTGLDTGPDQHSGSYVNCAGGNIVAGRSYFIWSSVGNSWRLDEKNAGGTDLAGNIAAASFDIDLQVGWNMISNPYTERIPLNAASGPRCTVVRNGVESASFAAAVASGWIDNSIHEWQATATGYTGFVYNGTPAAVLEPWKGYWIYVPDNTFATMKLRVYR